MKVILIEDVEKKGHIGDIINVKDGYANNYLIPRKLALPATESNIKHVKSILVQKARKLEKLKEKAIELLKKIDGTEIQISKPVGKEGKLFGSVTSSDIAEALKAKGFDIERKQVLLNSPIKAVGLYTIKVRLHPEVSATIKLDVKPQEN